MGNFWTVLLVVAMSMAGEAEVDYLGIMARSSRSQRDIGGKHPGVRCPHGWIAFQSSCYGFGNEALTWAAAQGVCHQLGGSLVEVNNAEENDFLKVAVRSRKYAAVWLGGTDMFSEGHWIWSSSKRLIRDGGFTDWSPGQPNSYGPGQHCLDLGPSTGYRWNDGTCTSSQHFICEIKRDTKCQLPERRQCN